MDYSQLQLSLELRNCFPYVRPSDATNLGQFLSDHFHIVYGTFYRHCECFYRKMFLTRPTPSAPAPFLGYFGVFFSETLGHRFQPIWDCPVWIFIFLASLGLSLGVIFLFGPNSIFGPWGGGQGVAQNEFLKTWSCYIVGKHFWCWFWILNLFGPI